jgi:NAD(P)-dependent dehydrogenase (short-subunit alcohol dehydrogenase family)
VATDAENLSRMTLAVVDAPLPSMAATLDIPGIVVITDGGGPLANLLSERLAANGIPSEIISIGSRGHASGRHLTLDAAASSGVIEAVRRDRGPIAALVHLAPIGELPTADDEAFFDRLRREVTSLFLIARAVESDLREARGIVVAATALGGAFCVGPHAADVWPGSGAVSGFIKTLAREWPEVTCKTVDFDRTADIDQVAEALLLELGCRDGLTEVGYQQGRRVTLGISAAPLGREPRLALDREAVILVTGGARGITADIARELAERLHPTLVLVGRSSLPDAPEPPDLAACADARGVKAFLIDRRRRRVGAMVPMEIEAECRRTLQAREIRATIAALKQTGASVEYHAVDVANAALFGPFIDGLYARLGRIDGVVHGAGIIEDKLVRDKTAESFDRVLRPKVAGALTLASKLRHDTLRFLVFCSSVSARFGNRGQCDYAAANEVLNKLATSLCRRGTARVVSINWGPWQSSGGMVSAGLAQRFADAGVKLISRAQGRRAFWDELLHGDRDVTEVVWGDRLAHVTQEVGAGASAATATRGDYPLVGDLNDVRQNGDGSIHLELHTGPKLDAYLADHLLDGVPVMPAAVAMELMAEAAAAHGDGLCTGVSNVKALHGIAYPEFESRTLCIEVTEMQRSSHDVTRVAVSITSDGTRRPVHYRGDVTFASGLDTPPAVEPLRLVNSRALPLSIEDAYQQWLFHGPRFAGITRVEALGDNGIVGRLRCSTPSALVGRRTAGGWLVDPVIVDSGLQLLILWSRACFDETPLPSRLRSCHRYVRTLPKEVVCEAVIDRRRGSSTLECDLRFFDDERRLLLRMEGMEVTCSRSLNRLSDARTAGAGA